MAPGSGAQHGGQAHARSGTILGFDFGLQRIGVAVGNGETRTAQPLATIAAADSAARFAAIGRLIETWQPALLVVGLPGGGDGAHPFAARCRRFANQLHGRYGLPVVLVDEAYSSADAEARLRELQRPWRERKSKLDALAAQAIVTTYLSSLADAT